MIQILYCAIWAGLAYFTYLKCILLYYRYFYYKLQGIPCIGFPLPFLGNILHFIRSLRRLKDYTWTPLEEYYQSNFPKG